METKTELAQNAYKNKEKITLWLNQYRIPLTMISLIHEVGTEKYQCYSWQNNPALSDSLPSNNIDAMMRHFGAHTMGQPIDVDGFPHIFHLVCRAGMFITSCYRTQTGILEKVKYKDIRTSFPNNCSVGLQLTSEEILSLTKRPKYSISPDLEELEPLLQGLMVDFAMDVETENKFPSNWDMFVEPWRPDYIFLACVEYANVVWRRSLRDKLDRDLCKGKPYEFMYKSLFN